MKFVSVTYLNDKNEKEILSITVVVPHLNYYWSYLFISGVNEGFTVFFQLCMVTIQLFKTLLELNCEDIIFSLIFR